MKSNKKNFKYGWIKDILIMLLGAYLFTVFVIQSTIVRGESMVPTLQGGELVLVSKWRPYVCDPQRGEVVIIHPNNEPQPWIKRVIGVAGDRISIVEGKVYLNGKPLEEPYINAISSRATAALRNMSEIIVPKDNVFVMGDNRDYSKDSRRVGPIPKDKIKGRAEFIMFPFSEWGSL